MASPPTLYDYYTSDGISQGLSDSQPHFTLNRKPITLYSGAVHYFRVPPRYWRDRLRKLRAAGLNTVETYVPWNLHEPEPGSFDFGEGTTDWSEFLDLPKFLTIAQEEDLLVIARPGPYICAEWDFGGLPSWLLRKSIKIRSSDPEFLKLVEIYFKKLLGVLSGLQFTKGGPIIAFQIENEYGNTKVGEKPVDLEYLESLKEILHRNDIVELLFTSDTPSNGFSGTLPGVLATANFQSNPKHELGLLKEYQPDKPLMVMEYWTGWFDHWTEKHHTRSIEEFSEVLDEILAFGASVNMYMFHGGTNWGFLNGANIKGTTTDNSAYQPDTTSYDYDAPLSETGDYTEKYFKVKELIQKYTKTELKLPEMPEVTPRKQLPTVAVTEMLTLNDLIAQGCSLKTENVLPMELLDINNAAGQSYGYVVYRKDNLDIAANSVLKIEGHVCDTVLVLINGKLVGNYNDVNGFGFWKKKDSSLVLGECKSATLDLLVENFGRCNYGKLNQFNQHKGLWQGNVLINETVVENWKITPLEFKRQWTECLESWKPVERTFAPKLYRATFHLDDPVDTFLDMREWTKGTIIVNGFVLARYWRLGPQQTAFLPAPFLKKGPNQILIFEHFTANANLSFVKDPIFETCT